MFESKQRGTVIAKGLKNVGSVTAEGLVEVNGQIDGELHCTSLVIARGAHVTGTVAAERVVVDGTVEGPIQGGEVHSEIASSCGWRYSPPVARHRKWCLLRWSLRANSGKWTNP